MPDNAIEDCTQAINLDSSNLDALATRGVSFFEKKDYEKANSDIRKISKVPNTWKNSTIGYDRIAAAFAASCYQLGRAALTKKEYDKAIDNFSAALDLKAYFSNDNVPLLLAEAYYNRGLGHYSRKEYEATISDFTEVLANAPKFARQGFRTSFADCYLQLGHPYARRGSYSTAISQYTKALEVYDGYGEAVNCLAIVREMQANAQKSTSKESDRETQDAHVNVNALNLRAGPSVNTAGLVVMRRYEMVEILEEGKGWVRITYQDTPGFVNKSYLKMGYPSLGVTLGRLLNEIVGAIF